MKRSDIWGGLTLVFLGLGFGGEVLGFWRASDFLKGWPGLLLLAPCLIHIREQGVNRPNVIGLGISLGISFLQWYPPIFEYSGAFIFILIGIVLIIIPSPVPESSENL